VVSGAAGRLVAGRSSGARFSVVVLDWRRYCAGDMMDKPLSAPANAPAPRLPPGVRIYVVGDVHGHLDKLTQAHDWVRADLQRRPVAHPLLVHLGDLIDRGPDSAGCIDLLAAGPPLRGVPTISLMGNHEWMMLKALNGGSHDSIDRWLDNGGAEALHSWGLKSTSPPHDWLAAIPPRHLVFLRDLAPSHVSHGYLFVHAGVRPGVEMALQRPADLLWIRDAFLNWDGVMLPDAPDRIIVHGHTPSPAPTVKPNRLGLDTGAGKGGLLTCAALEDDDVRLFQTD
jgi:serine/threonine protein phosphatase 1